MFQTMIVSEDQDGKAEDCLILQRESPVECNNTRHGGKATDNVEKNSIIVDMREFRSELPALLHRRGIDIQPVTIAVRKF